jgi:hypothetical protein
MDKMDGDGIYLHQQTDPLGCLEKGRPTGSSDSERLQTSTSVFKKPLPDRLLDRGITDAVEEVGEIYRQRRVDVRAVFGEAGVENDQMYSDGLMAGSTGKHVVTYALTNVCQRKG